MRLRFALAPSPVVRVAMSRLQPSRVRIAHCAKDSAPRNRSDRREPSSTPGRLRERQNANAGSARLRVGNETGLRLWLVAFRGNCDSRSRLLFLRSLREGCCSGSSEIVKFWRLGKRNEFAPGKKENRNRFAALRRISFGGGTSRFEKNHFVFAERREKDFGSRDDHRLGFLAGLSIRPIGGARGRDDSETRTATLEKDDRGNSSIAFRRGAHSERDPNEARSKISEPDLLHDRGSSTGRRKEGWRISAAIDDPVPAMREAWARQCLALCGL